MANWHEDFEDETFPPELGEEEYYDRLEDEDYSEEDDHLEADYEDRYTYDDEPPDGFLSDAEADGDALRNIGWGTDEDYGYFGDE